MAVTQQYINKQLRKVVPILFVLAAIGCTDESCYETLVAPLRVDIVSLETGKPMPFDSIKVETPLGDLRVLNVTIKGVGAPRDSALYRKSTGLKRLELPLKDKATETSFEVIYELEQERAFVDTLTFHHESRENFISVYCGCMFFYYLDTVRVKNETLVKEVKLLNQNITNEEEIHMLLGY